MIINYYYCCGGAGRGNKIKRYKEKKEKKEVLRGERFIYYNNPY